MSAKKVNSFFQSKDEEASFKKWGKENAELTKRFSRLTKDQLFIGLCMAIWDRDRRNKGWEEAIALLRQHEELIPKLKAQAARMATMDSWHKIRVYDQMGENLADGRKKGEKARVEKAKGNQEIIHRAITEVLEKEGWKMTNDEVAKYVFDHQKQYGLKKGYTLSTVGVFVKKVRALQAKKG